MQSYQLPNPNNLHVSKVHRITPSRHILARSQQDNFISTGGAPSARAISTVQESKPTSPLSIQRGFDMPF